MDLLQSINMGSHFPRKDRIEEFPEIPSNSFYSQIRSFLGGENVSTACANIQASLKKVDYELCLKVGLFAFFIFNLFPSENKIEFLRSVFLGEKGIYKILNTEVEFVPIKSDISLFAKINSFIELRNIFIHEIGHSIAFKFFDPDYVGKIRLYETKGGWGGRFFLSALKVSNIARTIIFAAGHIASVYWSSYHLFLLKNLPSSALKIILCARPLRNLIWALRWALVGEHLSSNSNLDFQRIAREGGIPHLLGSYLILLAPVVWLCSDQLAKTQINKLTYTPLKETIDGKLPIPISYMDLDEWEKKFLKIEMEMLDREQAKIICSQIEREMLDREQAKIISSQIEREKAISPRKLKTWISYEGDFVKAVIVKISQVFQCFYESLCRLFSSKKSV